MYIVSGYDQVYRYILSPPASVILSVEGYPQGFSALESHSKEESFFTAMNENGIIRFNALHGVEWKSVLQSSEGTSLSCHPSGRVLAVGTTTGDLVILSTTEGAQISQLPISDQPITVLSYSPSGDTLAIGCGEGSLFILPVSDDGLGYHKISVLKVTTIRHRSKQLFYINHFQPCNFLTLCFNTLQGELPLIGLQWSVDDKFIMTTVIDEQEMQEHILCKLFPFFKATFYNCFFF